MHSYNKVVAQFKFEDIFNITRIGLVIVGQIIDGEISPGNSIYIKQNNDGQLIKILGLSQGHTHENNFIGLNINIKNMITENELKKLFGKVFDVVE